MDLLLNNSETVDTLNCAQMCLRSCNTFSDSFVIRDYVMKVLSPQNNFPEAIAGDEEIPKL